MSISVVESWKARDIVIESRGLRVSLAHDVFREKSQLTYFAGQPNV